MPYVTLLFLSKLQYIAFKLLAKLHILIHPTILGIHIAKCVFRRSANHQPRIFQLCIQCNLNLEALQFDSFPHSFTPGNSLFPFLPIQIPCDMSLFQPSKFRVFTPTFSSRALEKSSKASETLQHICAPVSDRFLRP